MGIKGMKTVKKAWFLSELKQTGSCKRSAAKRCNETRWLLKLTRGVRWN
jgi:hypothetical protein